jgi:hypothetical protein
MTRRTVPNGSSGDFRTAPYGARSRRAADGYREDIRGQPYDYRQAALAPDRFAKFWRD